MSCDERQKSFIGYLLNLAKEGQEDRGALADLRSGIGKEPGDMARVHKHVVPYLPERDYTDRWYYVTATLFGTFPKYSRGYSLGAAFRQLKQKSDSMEARFVALLNAHPDDIDDHLRHAVSLLKSNEQPLDWFRLLDDLLQWDHPEGHVQLKWARDFYKSAAEQPDSLTDANSDTTLTEGERKP
ncbi:MAG: type I-E CRISPR-associated protein Cse2/CasB [Fimbriimonadaceae bacterium]|nr:type I-E CRISPR-associated protein Cse2/CasB [Fimbriimonadaceae bacterium]